MFVGVAVQPSIATVQPKIDNIDMEPKENIEQEYIEITTEFCGLPGMKPHTIQLTREQAEKLDRLFDSINEQLDKVETMEETRVIFNDAVIELDKYGVLGGLSVEQAQQLVTGRFQNSRIMRFLYKIHRNHQRTYQIDTSFCSIVAHIKEQSGIVLPMFIYTPFEYMKVFLFLISILITLMPFWFSLSSVILVGYWHLPFKGHQIIEPANGWVRTDGIFGKQEIEGSFIGCLGEIQVGSFNPMDLEGWGYIGAKGFRGIKIRNLITGSQKYIGHARRVALKNI